MTRVTIPAQQQNFLPDPQARRAPRRAKNSPAGRSWRGSSWRSRIPNIATRADRELNARLHGAYKRPAFCSAHANQFETVPRADCARWVRGSEPPTATHLARGPDSSRGLLLWSPSRRLGHFRKRPFESIPTSRPSDRRNSLSRLFQNANVPTYLMAGANNAHSESIHCVIRLSCHFGTRRKC